MRISLLLVLPALLLALACGQEQSSLRNVSLESSVNPDRGDGTEPWLNADGEQLATRFNPSPGFERVAYGDKSFGYYLRSQSLKPHGSKVMLHDGTEKYRQDVHAAVLDVSVGEADLQQCADAVMRLRAEYLLAVDRPDNIHFNFVNGFRAEYARWRTGDRIWIKGNQAGWKTGTGDTPGRAAFDEYLRWVFMYANTASLEKELQRVPIPEMKAGDVLIHGGFPGHAVLVMDHAINPKTGEQEYLFAQSYMPAQDIHILKNPGNQNGNPWYNLKDFADGIYTPEWSFAASELSRFPR